MINWLKNIALNKSMHQAVFVYTGSLINGASLFALNLLLARSLDKETFGVFSLSILMLLTMAELSDFGLNAGILRFAPYYIANNEKGKLMQLLKTVWNWRLYLVIILTSAGIMFSVPIARYIFGRPEIWPYIMYTSFGIGGVVFLGFVATYLQASQRFIYNATLQSLKGFLRLLLVVILYILEVRDLWACLTVYVAVPWVLFLFSSRVLPAGFRSSSISKEVRDGVHSQLAKFSFWLTVSSLCSILASRVDQALISFWLGLEQVAIFTVAWQFIQLWPIFINAITSVLIPKFSSFKEKSEIFSILKKTLVWTSFAAMGIAFLVYPSQFLITLLFGEQYALSMPVYLILAYGLTLSILMIPFSIIITIFNKTQLVAFSGIMQIVINIVGNIIFIPRYGVIGAAYVFILAMILQMIWNISCAVFLLTKRDFVVK